MVETRQIANNVTWRGDDKRQITVVVKADDFRLIEERAISVKLATGSYARRLLAAAIRDPKLLQKVDGMIK